MLSLFPNFEYSEFEKWGWESVRERKLQPLFWSPTLNCLFATHCIYKITFCYSQSCPYEVAVFGWLLFCNYSQKIQRMSLTNVFFFFFFRLFFFLHFFKRIYSILFHLVLNWPKKGVLNMKEKKCFKHKLLLCAQNKLENGVSITYLTLSG